MSPCVLQTPIRTMRTCSRFFLGLYELGTRKSEAMKDSSTMDDTYNYSIYLSIFKIIKSVQSKMSFKSAFAYNTIRSKHVTCPVTQLHSCVCLINASLMLPCTVAVGRRAHICSHTCSLPLELAPTRACSCGWKALMLQTELRCSLLKVATGRDWCTEYTSTCGCGRAGVVGSHT